MATRPKPQTDPHADAFAQIDAWVDTFLSAHEQRLSRPHEFSDGDNPRLVAAERGKIHAQAAAIRER
jgi:hypothetical protein